MRAGSASSEPQSENKVININSNLGQYFFDERIVGRVKSKQIGTVAATSDMKLCNCSRLLTQVQLNFMVLNCGASHNWFS